MPDGQGVAAHRIYGPGTDAIRLFLQRLAALDEGTTSHIVAAYERLSPTRAFVLAEAMLGESIARSDRTSIRDALAGPLLQLVQRRDAQRPDNGEPDGYVAGIDSASPDDEPELAPIAEPALAAVLALLMQDLLGDAHFDALYAPFATAIPVGSLVRAAARSPRSR